MSYNESSNKYKLTVAVLTYNRANMLKEMLDSILLQTYKDFYVIIYDNCSEDNTPEIVKPYLSDERFTYHRHTVSIGGENGNYALKYCNTEYLLVVHDDDTMLPDMVKREIAILDSYDDVSLVSTLINHIDTNSKIIEPSATSLQMNNHDYILNRKEYIEFLINKGNIILCPTVMFRMSVIKSYNLKFRTEIGGACDIYFWIEINQLNYKIYIINNALYNYRIHNLQDSHNTLVLFPLLRKPVYNFLVENKYSKYIIKSWLRRVEDVTVHEICKQRNKKKAFEIIKNKILFQNKRDLLFLLKIYCALYFYDFYHWVKHMIKKSLLLQKLYHFTKKCIRKYLYKL